MLDEAPLKKHRVSTGIDLEHDRANRDAGSVIACPLQSCASKRACSPYLPGSGILRDRIFLL